MPPRRQARDCQIGVIDIGSNSVRFVVYHVFGRAFTPIYNEKVLAGLGRDLHKNGCLSVAGKLLALSALKRFKIIADNLQLEDVLIAATAALRDAKDAPEFIQEVRRDIGFDISPLSGTDEALMSALGVLAGEPRAHGLCADLGGASLELIPIDQGNPGQGSTYKLGPFSVYEGDFNPLKARQVITSALSAIAKSAMEQDLYLVGGAWRNLALIHQKRTSYPLRLAQNYRLSAGEAKQLAQWAYSPQGRDVLKSWPGLSPRRAETLPYAGLLLEALLDRVGAGHAVIAPGGLRDGLVYRYLGPLAEHENALFDGCRDLAHGNEQGVGFGEPLFDVLQGATSVFPSSFHHKNENRLRKAACLLVGIGKGLHPEHKAKMVFRTVLYAPIFGLTHKERCYLALMLYASYTSKSTTPNENTLAQLLTPDEQKAARAYGYAMRLAVTLSARSVAVLKHLKFKHEPEALFVILPGHLRALINEKIILRTRELSQLIDVPISVEYDPS
ncbi:MAG TPA: Ppx/GppA family phosphatase [Hellea balneolensis]|uniref:Ppx/GppA family phosphatase n=1 Tax=Hellea balneolensis TaxID=287478 RepID=A0A7C5QX28_9PROT|nr:Ppx/GppA family phosphatase [Hellea balneolensis]